ncbi:MAG: hypothetical protein H5U40_08475 [Polyangiaceae bacterium]|nr:hypothetical protein [Polyangiaceae bacterium]
MVALTDLRSLARKPPFYLPEERAFLQSLERWGVERGVAEIVVTLAQPLGTHHPP